MVGSIKALTLPSLSGALAFDDRQNLLFWLETSPTNTSLYVKNCSNSLPPAIISDAVPAYVGQLSLDTNNSVVYLSAAALGGGSFHSVPYSGGPLEHILKNITEDKSSILFSQLTFDPTTSGYSYVQVNESSATASIVRLVPGAPPQAIVTLPSYLIVATFDPTDNIVIFTDGTNVYRCVA